MNIVGWKIHNGELDQQPLFIDGTMKVLTCKYHDGGTQVLWYMYAVGSTV